jgi:thioredoxin 1
MKNDRPAWLANKQTSQAPKSRVRPVNDATFEREVVASEVPVLVDFWAPWCGPCKMIAPMVEKLAEEYEGRVKVMKMDTESNPGVPGAMGIRSIPTLLVFKGKDVVDSRIGAGSIDDLRKMLDRSLGVRKPGLLGKLFG